MTLSTPTLQPYVPRLVLDWQRTAPGARYREIEGSMVFVDVSGFTKMSERLARQGKVGAEEVSDVINDTFTALLAQAYANGGGLLKFGGDALLLFFSGDGHPLRATAAAHGMRAELRRIGAFTTSAGKVILRMSVGAHTGLFHFFLVGDSHRELIVAGPAATETVTMEGAASAGQILLSPALASILPRANRGRELGPGVLLAGTPPEVASLPVELLPAELDLAPFVSRGLRDTLQQGEVEPEHRVVTIAFVHYGGFDELLANEGPEAAAAALEELVRSAQKAVDDRGIAFLATDIAPDGGKLILAAGAPVVTGADEEGMLLALRDVVATETLLPLRIGVNLGPVFAGTIGPSYRRTYTVMGDAVNLAARLMAKAEHRTVVATPQVLDGSRTLFETEELEPFLVKGKKHLIEAYVVGEAKGSRTSIAEAGLPLIGRDEELAALEAAWARAAGGQGMVIELSAEPGMGKSRLLEEFLSHHRDIRILRGECRLYQAATPYFPLRTVLRDAFGLVGLGDDESPTALELFVRRRSPDNLPWLALIGTALDLELQPSREVEELEDEFRRARLEQAVAEVLAATATEPTVILVEDTHWMDEPSRDLLSRLTGTLEERPWLVLHSTRPVADHAAGDDSVTRIDLQPLDSSQAAALIDAATEHEPLMPHQVSALAGRAAGNPLFLLELLDALRRGEDVNALPHSVEALIHARIDRLPPADRTRLREVSVLGAGFRVEHVASALADGRSTTRVRAALDRLGDFMSVDSKGWAQFHHALIRDAAYEGVPYAKRKTLHARVGDSIRESAGDTAEEQAELLSLHYSAAGRWEEAWTYSRIAGDEARDVYANVEAARFYERALAAGGRLGGIDDAELAGVWRSLGAVREASGEFESAFGALRVATRLHHADPVAQADIHYVRALSRIRLGSYRLALRETAAGLRLLDSTSSRAGLDARARLVALRADIRLQQGHAREAIALANEAAREAESVGSRHALAKAYSVLDGGYLQLGEPEKAVLEQKAADIYRELGELRSAAVMEMNLGVQAYAEGRWDDAVSRYTLAQEELRRVGDAAQAGLVGANLGEVLIGRGDLGTAETVLVSAWRALRASGLAAAAVFAETQLARLELERGRCREAAGSLRKIVDEARALDHPFLVVDASIHLAEAHRRMGDPHETLGVLANAERVGGDEAVQMAAAIGRVRAATLIDLGRIDEATVELEDALTLARNQGLLYEEALLLLVRSGLTAPAGHDPGHEDAQEARCLLRVLGVRGAD